MNDQREKEIFVAGFMSAVQTATNPLIAGLSAVERERLRKVAERRNKAQEILANKTRGNRFTRALRLYFKRMFGGWRPETDGSTWGIYHATKYHSWGFGMTFEDAQDECDYRNNHPEIGTRYEDTL